MIPLDVRSSGGQHQVTVDRFFQMTILSPEYATIDLVGDFFEVVQDGSRVEIRIKERYAYMAPEIRKEMADLIEGEK